MPGKAHPSGLNALTQPLRFAVARIRMGGARQVPILERTADKRWGKEAAYNAYKQRVPVFFPRLF